MTRNSRETGRCRDCPAVARYSHNGVLFCAVNGCGHSDRRAAPLVESQKERRARLRRLKDAKRGPPTNLR
jgi:hypothetical protein